MMYARNNRSNVRIIDCVMQNNVRAPNQRTNPNRTEYYEREKYMLRD